jgi:pimeloyl-ACP methyl ester carboxylesterase
MWLFGKEPKEGEQRTATPTEENAHAAMLTLCATATSVSLINLPRSDEFVVNSRGQKLHVRSSWPAPQLPVRGIFVYCHGYGGHCSRPWVPFLCRQLNEKGFAFVGLDWHGFGYSEGVMGAEGVVKALVGTVDDFVDDVMSLLSALYATSPHDGKLNRTANASTPFVLSGFSMGGPAVALAASHVMSVEPVLVPLFKGCVFIAPAFEVRLSPPLTQLPMSTPTHKSPLTHHSSNCHYHHPLIQIPLSPSTHPPAYPQVKRPSAMTSMVLQNLVVPCFAATPIPAAISTPPDHTNSWKHEGIYHSTCMQYLPACVWLLTRVCWVLIGLVV